MRVQLAQLIDINKLITDRTQSRAAMNEEVINEYKDAIDALEARRDAGDVIPLSEEFPDPVVYLVGGQHYHVVDGAHRVEAYKRAGWESILCDVRTGSLRDAIQYSLSANERHGLQRTNADKNRAVEIALADPEWRELPKRELARLCGVSHTFVNNFMKKLNPLETFPEDASTAAPAELGGNVSSPTESDDEHADVEQVELPNSHGPEGPWDFNAADVESSHSLEADPAPSPPTGCKSAKPKLVSGALTEEAKNRAEAKQAIEAFGIGIRFLSKHGMFKQHNQMLSEILEGIKEKFGLEPPQRKYPPQENAA